MEIVYEKKIRCISILKSFLMYSIDHFTEEYGPAPWIDPNTFYIIRFLLTGGSVFLSLYTFAEKLPTIYKGFDYFTYWGTHGTMLAFIYMWLPYTNEMLPAHMLQGYPAYAMDWLDLWAQYHYQTMQLYEFVIALIYFICPLYPTCPYDFSFPVNTPT